jgi:hypothetical protein
LGGLAMNRFCVALLAACFFVTIVGISFAGKLEDASAADSNGDYATALKLYEWLADKNNASAQLALGLMYAKGKGVPPDINEALKWFQYAAENPTAAKDVHEDATYNRDFISRKLKEKEEAEALQAAADPKASRAAVFFTFADGSKYVGEFKDSKPNGQGTRTLTNGTKYVGEYKDGEENGQGTVTWANGDKYVGEFKDGKPNGQGTYIWANGDKYVGEFKDSKRNGQGTFTGVNGDKYVGEFKYDKQHGKGTLTKVNGSIISAGIWFDGKFVGATASSTMPDVPSLISNVRLNRVTVENGSSSGTISMRVENNNARTVRDPKVSCSYRYGVNSGKAADAYPLAIVIRPGESRPFLENFRYNPHDDFDCKVVDLVAVSDDELEFFSVGGTLEGLHELEAGMKGVGAKLEDVLPAAISIYKARQGSEQASPNK